MSQDQAAAGLRIAFAGTPDFAAAHLKALIDNGADIVAVYTQPDRPAGRGKKLTASPVKALALEHGLPVYQPDSLKTIESRQQLEELKPDIMVVVAYGLLIPPAILAIPNHGCINVHGSLLPRWRGAAPIQRAIEAGDRETGITIMQMDEGLDTGDMLLKASCPIDDNDTGGSLHDKLAELGPPALINALEEIAHGKAQPEKQDDNHSNYARKITKAEAAIDWSLDATVIERKVRAFNPFPVAYSALEGKTVRLWSAVSNDLQVKDAPGTILSSDTGGVVVACGSGALSIQVAQLPGKKPLPMADILRGNADLFTPGKRFTGPDR